MHAHTHTHTHTHARARARAHARTHTHTHYDIHIHTHFLINCASQFRRGLKLQLFRRTVALTGAVFSLARSAPATSKPAISCRTFCNNRTWLLFFTVIYKISAKLHTHSNARSITHFFRKFAGLTRSSSEPLQGRVKGGITILQFHVTGPGSRTQSTRPSYCVHLSTSPEMTGRTQHNRRCPRVEASSLVFPRLPSSSLIFSRPLTCSLVLPRLLTSTHVLPRPSTSFLVLLRPLTRTSLQNNNVFTIICFDRFIVTVFWFVSFLFVFCFVLFLLCLIHC